MLTKINDKIITFIPAYYPFMDAVKNNGRILIKHSLIYDSGNIKVDLDKFEEQIVKNDVKLFIFCSPHNPLGRV